MMRTFRDQMHRDVQLKTSPSRIISLVPSQTELLHHLGLEEEVIGITKFCIHPEKWYRTKTRVGGTKQVDLNKIEALQPNLIIANKEENTREELEFLSQKYPLWISDIQNVEEAFEMIALIGELVDRTKEATQLLEQLRDGWNTISTKRHRRVAYLIWNNPMMSVNADTYIHSVITKLGWENVFAHRSESRYPTVTMEEIVSAGVDEVLLSSEPFPFGEKHIQAFESHGIRARLVDGEMFSWYGSRMLEAIDYLHALE